MWVVWHHQLGVGVVVNFCGEYFYRQTQNLEIHLPRKFPAI